MHLFFPLKTKNKFIYLPRLIPANQRGAVNYLERKVTVSLHMLMSIIIVMTLFFSIEHADS